MAGFIAYQDKNGQEYATFCIAKWTGEKKINETEYLGKVIDKEKGIFFSRKDGFYIFTEEGGRRELTSEEKQKIDEEKRARRPYRKDVAALDFGDVFFIDSFLKTTPYYDLFASILPGDKELLLSLVYSYVLHGGAREYVRDWWDGSFACCLFPDAVPYGSKISGLYARLSDVALQHEFSRRYFNTVFSGPGIHGVLIDSTGVPNAISMDKREYWNHDGDCDEGARLIYVCERNTGLPLHARSISGNIIDGKTISNTIDELERAGVCTDYAILDAGYYTDENVNIFYDKEISFITRVKRNRTLYKDVLAKKRAMLEDPQNMVTYHGRVLYVLKDECNLCSHRAWYYFVLDVAMQAKEMESTLPGLIEDKVSADELKKSRDACGVFMMISSEDLTADELLPLYYTRTQVEQVSDIAKGSGELLQLGMHSQEVFEGHIFVSFLATIICHLLQNLFKGTNLNTNEALTVLRNHKCKVYNNGDVVPYEPKKKQNTCYDLISVKPQQMHFDNLKSIW